MPVVEGDTGVLSVGSSRSEVPVGRPDGSGFQAAGLELSRGVSRARRGRGGDSGRLAPRSAWEEEGGVEGREAGTAPRAGPALAGAEDRHQARLAGAGGSPLWPVGIDW